MTEIVFLEFPNQAVVEGQPMWATSFTRRPDGSADTTSVSVSVIVLTFGRARIVRHRGYTPADWSPEEGW